jgi:hypothetical protein
MPLKLFAGISKKMGLPNYGSLGAVCQVELDLDGSLTEQQREAFAEHVRECYAACRQAVEEELQRHRAALAAEQPQAAGQQPGNHDPVGGGNGSPAAAAGSNGHDAQPASSRQIEYARLLAGQIRGLGLRRVESFCQALVSKPLAELSSADAGRLIDTLIAIRAGRLELASVLDGAQS